MSQDTLSKKLGIERSIISRYESGDVNLSIDRISDIASVLGVSIANLIDSHIRTDSSDLQSSIKIRRTKDLVLSLASTINSDIIKIIESINELDINSKVKVGLIKELQITDISTLSGNLLSVVSVLNKLED